MRLTAPKERETDILRTIMDGLAAKRIWRMRMNVGAVTRTYKGKMRLTRFGYPGVADILAFAMVRSTYKCECTKLVSQEIRPIWIECKTAPGKQSADQKAFQAEVEAEGHRYILVRSWEDLEKAL